MQNMLLRFSEKNKLKVALPRKGNYFGGITGNQNVIFTHHILAGADKFHHTMVHNGEEEGYSILCLHTRFNMEEMDKVLGADTAYVTMLRDPVSVFESAWHFYGLQRHFRMDIGKGSFQYKKRLKV